LQQGLASHLFVVGVAAPVRTRGIALAQLQEHLGQPAGHVAVILAENAVLEITAPVAAAHEIGHTMIGYAVMHERWEVQSHMRGIIVGYLDAQLDFGFDGFFVDAQDVLHGAGTGFLAAGFFGGQGYVIPGHDAEHEIGVGYGAIGYVFAGLATQACCSIAPGFGYGSQVDLADRRQDYVVLMIQGRIQEAAVCVLAEVYLFEYVSIVEVIHTRWVCAQGGFSC
jgi:hypothetical protein